jgi:hypothetical protein
MRIRNSRFGKLGKCRIYNGKNACPSSLKPGLAVVLLRLANLAENKRSTVRLRLR